MWRRAGSLTVGPGAPLVRFDQSPLPPLLCPSRGGASGDHHRRTAFLRRHLGAGMDPPLLGGPPGGRRVAEGGGSRRRRALRRREGFGGFGDSGHGDSREGLRCWAGPQWKHRRGLGALALAVFCRSEVAAAPAGVGEDSGPWPTGEGERLPTARVRLLKSLGRIEGFI